MITEFIVMGTPVAKGRPRFARRGNWVQSYTPEKTVNYENLVKLSYSQYSGIKFIGAIRAEIQAYFPIPKSVSKKKRLEMMCNAEKYIKKPDNDNIAKAILDALNGIAYDDDSQITELLVTKAYSDKPRAEVKLIGLDEVDFSQFMNPSEE